MPPKDSADWISNPEDITHVVDFLHKHRSRVGQGGNFPMTVFNEAADYMAEKWPPTTKTATSIMSKYRSISFKSIVTRHADPYRYRNLNARRFGMTFLPIESSNWLNKSRVTPGFDLIEILRYRAALQKVYPGGSGWTYTHELGFNVKEQDRDAWNNFAKAHPHFKPFATKGWEHFDKMDEIIPSTARGRHVYNAASRQPAGDVSGLGLQSQSQSQGDDDDDDDDDDTSPNPALTQSSDFSQPFSDAWSQSNYGDSQSLSQALPQSQALAVTQSAASHTAVAPPVPTTPAPTLKRAPVDVDVPWSTSKRSRVSGPESIMALGRSVEGIGRVIETVLAPPKSSSMSPTKKVTTARAMALEDMDNLVITPDERTRLHILFGRDVTAADAYISDADPRLRAAIATELLNPTQNFNYH
ncbi:hypothetical protein DFH06DRAFT_1436225 [Mycena polygramma]|nr:hypothetical protein DFH06DRAFT_1436225 [Mycena polygramma]